MASSIPVSVPSYTIPCRLPSTRSKVPGSQYGGDAGGEEMRLTCLDARQDAQIGKFLATTRQVGGVALDVERCHPWPGADARRLGNRRRGSGGELSRVLLAPLGEIDVLGERQPWKADLDGAGAGELHR